MRTKKSLGNLGNIKIHEIVEMNNCIFNSVHEENDIGIDGYIEIINEGKGTGKIIAIQVKTGDSFFNSKKSISSFDLGKHWKYWENYTIPVYGVVGRFSEETGIYCAFWVDIKKYIKENKNDIESGKIKKIKFENCELNSFDILNFKKYFIPHIFRFVPLLPIDECFNFLNNTHNEKNMIALQSLFTYHFSSIDVWDKFLQIFKERKTIHIPFIIYIFSHVTGHSDLWIKNTIPFDIKKKIMIKFENFERDDILLLLTHVDEAGFERGSLGQAIESIICKIKNRKSILHNILFDDSIDMVIREMSALLYAYYFPSKALVEFKRIKNNEIINFFHSILVDEGFINLY